MDLGNEDTFFLFETDRLQLESFFNGLVETVESNIHVATHTTLTKSEDIFLDDENAEAEAVRLGRESAFYSTQRNRRCPLLPLRQGQDEMQLLDTKEECVKKADADEVEVNCGLGPPEESNFDDSLPSLLIASIFSPLEAERFLDHGKRNYVTAKISNVRSPQVEEIDRDMFDEPISMCASWSHIEKNPQRSELLAGSHMESNFKVATEPSQPENLLNDDRKCDSDEAYEDRVYNLKKRLEENHEHVYEMLEWIVSKETVNNVGLTMLKQSRFTDLSGRNPFWNTTDEAEVGIRNGNGKKYASSESPTSKIDGSIRNSLALCSTDAACRRGRPNLSTDFRTRFYSCDYCGNAYLHKYGLKCHLIAKHCVYGKNGAVLGWTATQKHDCKLCDASFDGNRKLLKHIKESHDSPPQPRYRQYQRRQPKLIKIKDNTVSKTKCPTDHSYSQNVGITSSKRRNTMAYTCRYCSRKFTRRDHYTNHMSLWCKKKPNPNDEPLTGAQDSVEC